jgi:hypothetical protein
MRNIIFVSLAILTITSLFILGCATAYQKSGFTGGYSETQLDDNVFVVSFRGNGYTKRERVADFTLLRSAELALQHGFQFFAIIEANSYTSHSTYTTPTRSTTKGSAYSSGNYVYGSSTTRTTGGKTYNISKPSSSNTIVCFKDKPENTFTYNADFIYMSITQKYGIKK